MNRFLIKLSYKLLIPFFLIFFTGCFEIIHSLQKNKDNSVDVFWVFSISSNFTKDKDGDAGPPLPGGGINQKISNSETEIQEKLKDYVQDLKVQSFENEYEVGIKISYKIKDLKKITKSLGLDEGFPIAPRFTEKNELVFSFLPDKEKREKMKKKKKKSKPVKEDENPRDNPESDEDESEEPEMNENPQMEKMLSSIMSSASYMIFLGGEFSPKSSYVLAKKSKKKYPLELLKIGDQTMLKIPYFSLLMEEKEGYEVIVTF